MKKSIRVSMKKLVFVCAAGALLVAAPVGAYATDFCISGSTTLVGKKFKVPAHGKCKSFFGFFAPPNTVNSTTGQACTSEDDSHVVFTLTSTVAAAYVEWDHIELSLPGLTGTDNYTSVSGGIVSSASVAVTGAPCATPVPVP